VFDLDQLLADFDAFDLEALLLELAAIDLDAVLADIAKRSEQLLDGL
jgi:hypothetical protein